MMETLLPGIACPNCRGQSFERITRQWWMRLQPGIRRYRCLRCGFCFFTRFGKLRTRSPLTAEQTRGIALQEFELEQLRKTLEAEREKHRDLVSETARRQLAREERLLQIHQTAAGYRTVIEEQQHLILELRAKIMELEEKRQQEKATQPPAEPEPEPALAPDNYLGNLRNALAQSEALLNDILSGMNRDAEQPDATTL